MAIDRSTLTRQQQEWLETIEADPDLFVALAEETGLADQLRRRLKEPQGQPDEGQRQRNDDPPTPWSTTRALQQRTDQRNALARAIVQNAQGAGIHESTAPNEQKQEMRMVEVVRLAHELGDRAIQGNQAIRQRQALTSRLYEAGQSAGLVDATPNPDSSSTLQSMDTHAIIDGLSDAAAKGKRAIEQRDRLATSVAEAAQSAGLVTPGAEITGPQLLLLINDMGMAAKATVERNEMLTKLEQSGDRIITDADAMAEQAATTPPQQGSTYNPEMGKAAFAYLASFGPENAKVPSGFSFESLWNAMLAQHKAPQSGLIPYKMAMGKAADEYIQSFGNQQPQFPPGFRWAKLLDAMLLEHSVEHLTQASTDANYKNLVEWWGHIQNDYRKYAAGDPSMPFSSFRQTLDQFMATVEHTDLAALNPSNAKSPSSAPPILNNTQRDAIDHAIDVLSDHGNAVTSVGAMEVLGDMLKEANPASVPEVTDNVMRKANRAIGELTGNKHIGVTAKVINAVWDALNEDATPTNKPAPEPQLSDTARQHYEQLERTYFAIQHGDHTLTDADFKKHLEQFAAAVVDSGIARPIELGQPSAVAPGVMDEQQKAQINNALDILYRVGPSGITSPGAMATLQAMVKSYADPRTPDDKQAAEDDQNTLNTFLDDDYEDEGLSPRMG